MKQDVKQFSLLSIIPYLYYILFFVIPLFMSSRTSEIFEFNKMLSIYLITTLIISVYFLHIIIRREKVVMSVLFIPLLLFLLSQVLSTLFSIDVHTSIFGYYGRWNGGLVSIISYIALFYVGVQTLNYYHVKRLLLFSLITSFIVIMWGLPGKFGVDLSCYVFTGQLTNTCWTQEFNPSERMFSTLGQPNWLGAYLAIHFFIACYFLFSNIKHRHTIKEFLFEFFQKNTWFYTAYLILNSSIIWFTKSRSALLAVAVGIVLGSVFVLKEYVPFPKIVKKFFYFLIGLVFIVSIIWTIKSGMIADLFELPSEATAITDSFDIRKVVWKGAIDLGNMYPYFGSGVETFAYSYYFARPFEHNLTSEWDFIYNKAHNEYLNYFATTGYFGVVTYILFIVSFFVFCVYSLIKVDNKEKKILIVCSMLAFFTILITNFFGFSVSSIQMFFYILPAVIVVINREEIEYSSYSMTHIFKISPFKKGAAIIVVLLGISSAYYLYNYYTADILYAQSRANLGNDEYTEAYSNLTGALNKRYEHVYEDKLSNTAANLAFLDSFSEEKSLVPNLISLSKTLNDHSLQVSRNNILYLRTKGKNYYLYYQTTHDEKDLHTAVKVMEDAVDIAYTDVQTRYTLALFYYIASQEITDETIAAEYHDKTVKALQQIISFKPNYIEAQELYTEVINKE